MVEFIIWSDSYSTGIHDIDAQHIKIVRIINDLFVANQKDGLQGIELKKRLLLIKIYTETHFQYEETLMRYSQFPEYKEHRKYHLEMIQKTNEMIKEFYNSNQQQSEVLFQFLKKWWIEHIQDKDELYVPYLKKLGL